MKSGTAHSLIGKYIYIRYLRDRGILSDSWLSEHNIRIDEVLGRQATLIALQKLVNLLEERFRGQVFPLDLKAADAPGDDEIAYVASVFQGDTADGQLSFDFNLYEFSYIPVELLSSIYEQFLSIQGEDRGAGAYYTPETLADYLLTEIHQQKPLQLTYKILDPCCGSGVFLVLAYRRLIELAARQKHAPLDFQELKAILYQNIFGVERNREACYVTEFSLILTLLSYIDPPDLHQNQSFKFPELHNRQIFEGDFFDDKSVFWQGRRTFDWIVGNPPWKSLKPKADRANRLVLKWMDTHMPTRPVGQYRVSEAFAWRVGDVAAPEAMVGLLVPATTLTNLTSTSHRKAFFSANTVMKVTNFANLAYMLFDKRVDEPAASMVFKPGVHPHQAYDIVHHGPFVADQTPMRFQKSKSSWTLTVTEDEISVVSVAEALSGDLLPWKLALWGSDRDRQALMELERRFTQTLEEMCRSQQWHLGMGIQLRSDPGVETDPGVWSNIWSKHLSENAVLDVQALRDGGYRFTVPADALSKNDQAYYRRQGGGSGLRLIGAPHLVINFEFAVLGTQEFILPHGVTGVSGPVEATERLKALAVYLNSSVAKYLTFFRSPSWGITRTRFNLNDAKSISVPVLSAGQIAELAVHYDRFSKIEGRQWNRQQISQKDIDDPLNSILNIPDDLALLAQEFVTIRLQLNKGKVSADVLRPANPDELTLYAQTLKTELDEFVGLDHSVRLAHAERFILCEINVNPEENVDRVAVFPQQQSSSLTAVWEKLRTQYSQWTYIQKSLRIFDGSRLYILKSARRIDWTRTQALLDADDVIAEAIGHVEETELVG